MGANNRWGLLVNGSDYFPPPAEDYRSGSATNAWVAVPINGDGVAATFDLLTDGETDEGCGSPPPPTRSRTTSTSSSRSTRHSTPPRRSSTPPASRTRRS